MIPNIFEFATSELTQDAIICWLLSWAKPECALINKEMHECGTNLIHAFLSKAGIRIDKIHKIEVKKQYKHIDVLSLLSKTILN